MTGTTDKIKGATNEAIGKAKQGVGHMTGDTKMQADGAAQELKGDVQKAVGGAKTTAKHAINDAAKAANKNL